MSRPTLDDYFLDVAELTAERSTCKRGHVGAVLVIDKRIVSTGYNGSPPGMDHCTDVGCLEEPGYDGCQRTIHAEQNAINFAARKGIATEFATLYCTYTPCLSCAKSIIAAGISHVIAASDYRNADGRRLLEKAGIGIEIRGGQVPQGEGAMDSQPELKGPLRDSECRLCGGAIVGTAFNNSSLVCENAHHTVNPNGPVVVGQDNFNKRKDGR